MPYNVFNFYSSTKVLHLQHILLTRYSTRRAMTTRAWSGSRRGRRRTSFSTTRSSCLWTWARITGASQWSTWTRNDWTTTTPATATTQRVYMFSPTISRTRRRRTTSHFRRRSGRRASPRTSLANITEWTAVCSYWCTRTMWPEVPSWTSRRRICSKEKALNTIRSDIEKQNKLNKELSSKLQKAEEGQDNLRAKLQKHDLKRLSLKKPAWVEKILNDGTKKVFNDLESITTK